MKSIPIGAIVKLSAQNKKNEWLGSWSDINKWIGMVTRKPGYQKDNGTWANMYQVQWVNVSSLEAEYEANRMYYRHELKYAK